jgi:hypothetical protein
MKRNLSISTAAAALLIGTVFASAQGVQRPGNAGGGGAEPGIQGGAQGQGGAGGAQMPQEGQGKGKAQQQPRTQGQGGQGQRETQGQQEPGQPGQQPKQGQQKEGQQPKQQQGQQKEGQQPKQQQGQQTPQQGQPGAEGKGKAAEGKGGGAQSGGVTLNAQQRTTIRTTVLQGSNAPRVSNVNFSVNVGTVVPRTGVTLVAVPPTLIEIHPAWRNHVYFIVDDRIIIVEPESHRIVAVLVV